MTHAAEGMSGEASPTGAAAPAGATAPGTGAADGVPVPAVPAVPPEPPAPTELSAGIALDRDRLARTPAPGRRELLEPWLRQLAADALGV
ncbi:MAG TPA: hypothetical protein VJA16_17780, partial [Thermoanaerobaculia bacterium]